MNPDTPIELRLKARHPGDTIYHLQYREALKLDSWVMKVVNWILYPPYRWRTVKRYKKQMYCQDSALDDPNDWTRWEYPGDVDCGQTNLRNYLQSLKDTIKTYGDLDKRCYLTKCEQDYQSDMERWKRYNNRPRIVK